MYIVIVDVVGQIELKTSLYLSSSFIFHGYMIRQIFVFNRLFFHGKLIKYGKANSRGLNRYL